jgi:hypothetical protein
MYELSVLTCSRGLRALVPVPGAGLSRVNDMAPMSFVKLSSGSPELNAIELGSPPPSASPNTWSMNWPHVQPHWLTPRSENTFCPTSLKTRLLVKRGPGPPTCVFLPSA